MLLINFCEIYTQISDLQSKTAKNGILWVMYTFWLVLKDLWRFVWGIEDAPPPPLIAPKNLPLLAEVGTGIGTETVDQTPAETNEGAQPQTLPETREVQTLLHAPVVMYVSEFGGSPRLIAPLVEFDGEMEIIPYGAAVTVVGYRGTYASVLRAHHTGWVRKDHLVSDKLAVWPQLNVGERYYAADPDTKKVRALIGDEFGAGELALPLQPGEYILARLLDEQRRILWPTERPRLPGTWHTLLRGVSGIHASITPKTDAVMEWYTTDGAGSLAYVEAVAPDNTLALSLVGFAVAGEYQRLTFTESQWRELRPVFIEVA